MDRLQRFALKRVTDGLDKALEAKAHFDRREEKKSYSKRILKLREALNDLAFHGEHNERAEAYDNVQLLNRMLTEHELSKQDKLKIDQLEKRYTV